MSVSIYNDSTTKLSMYKWRIGCGLNNGISCNLLRGRSTIFGSPYHWGVCLLIRTPLWWFWLRRASFRLIWGGLDRFS